MKKIVILAFIIFALTGCGVRYNIEIKNDLSVMEEANLFGTESFYKTYYKTTKYSVLDSFLDNYKDILKNNNYTYELVDNINPYVNVKKNYDSIESYINNSILFNDYFEKINYTKNGKIAKIETEGFNINDPDNPDRFYVRDLKIAIKCNFKVTNTNATNYDKKNNIYYFEMNEDTKDFKILLEFNTASKFIMNQDIYILMIVMALIVIASWVAVFVLKKKNT